MNKEQNAPDWVSSVNPSEIVRQRNLGWPDFHPEDFCHICGHRNGNWFIDISEEAWYAITQGVGVTCPSCFMALSSSDKIWELRTFT